MIHCSELGEMKWAATRWVTADSSWRTWLLPRAARGRAGWWQYAKFSPHGITERKRRTASYSWSVLLSYKLICMWAFSSPLKFFKVPIPMKWCWWLIWPIQNDAKKLKNDWNLGTWVLIWEYLASTIQWIPTWQISMVYKNICILELWTKVALALERLNLNNVSYRKTFKVIIPHVKIVSCDWLT